ncbi:hypothetical protein HK104_011437 [Borealophlyctis nickersoniae]|nr:hypothetical protein HK104_011437 [Borealophlyctis nickersoniae]
MASDSATARSLERNGVGQRNGAEFRTQWRRTAQWRGIYGAMASDSATALQRHSLNTYTNCRLLSLLSTHISDCQTHDRVALTLRVSFRALIHNREDLAQFLHRTIPGVKPNCTTVVRLRNKQNTIIALHLRDRQAMQHLYRLYRTNRKITYTRPQSPAVKKQDITLTLLFPEWVVAASAAYVQEITPDQVLAHRDELTATLASVATEKVVIADVDVARIVRQVAHALFTKHQSAKGRVYEALACNRIFLIEQDRPHGYSEVVTVQDYARLSEWAAREHLFPSSHKGLPSDAAEEVLRLATQAVNQRNEWYFPLLEKQSDDAALMAARVMATLVPNLLAPPKPAHLDADGSNRSRVTEYTSVVRHIAPFITSLFPAKKDHACLSVEWDKTATDTTRPDILMQHPSTGLHISNAEVKPTRTSNILYDEELYRTLVTLQTQLQSNEAKYEFLGDTGRIYKMIKRGWIHVAICVAEFPIATGQANGDNIIPCFRTLYRLSVSTAFYCQEKRVE